VRFAAVQVQHRHVLATRTTAIETKPGVDREPLVQCDRVAHKPRRRDEHAAGEGWGRRDGLKRTAAIVNEPDTARDDCREAVLAFLELATNFPLVIPTPSRRLVTVDGAFRSRSDQRETAKCLGTTAEHIGEAIDPAWNRHIPAGRVVVPVVGEPSD